MFHFEPTPIFLKVVGFQQTGVFREKIIVNTFMKKIAMSKENHNQRECLFKN